MLFGHLRNGLIALLFDPNCSDLHVISQDVSKCICHTANIASLTSETRVPSCHLSLSRIILPFVLFCLVLVKVICQVSTPSF